MNLSKIFEIQFDSLFIKTIYVIEHSKTLSERKLMECRVDLRFELKRLKTPILNKDMHLDAFKNLLSFRFNKAGTHVSLSDYYLSMIRLANDLQQMFSFDHLFINDNLDLISHEKVEEFSQEIRSRKIADYSKLENFVSDLYWKGYINNRDPEKINTCLAFWRAEKFFKEILQADFSDSSRDLFSETIQNQQTDLVDKKYQRKIHEEKNKENPSNERLSKLENARVWHQSRVAHHYRVVFQNFNDYLNSMYYFKAMKKRIATISSIEESLEILDAIIAKTPDHQILARYKQLAKI